MQTLKKEVKERIMNAARVEFTEHGFARAKMRSMSRVARQNSALRSNQTKSILRSQTSIAYLCGSNPEIRIQRSQLRSRTSETATQNA